MVMYWSTQSILRKGISILYYNYNDFPYISVMWSILYCSFEVVKVIHDKILDMMGASRYVCVCG